MVIFKRIGWGMGCICVCLCVCVFVCVSVCVHVVLVSLYVYIYMHILTCTHTYMHTCTYIRNIPVWFLSLHEVNFVFELSLHLTLASVFTLWVRLLLTQYYIIFKALNYISYKWIDPRWEQNPELQGPQVTFKLMKNSMHSVLVWGWAAVAACGS